MKANVTNRQIFFVLFLTISSYTTIDLPKFMARTAGRSSWIPILAVTLIFACVAIIITKLNSIHKDKMLYDYGKEIVGKYISFVIVCYYILYFLYIGVLLKHKLIGVLTSNFLPLTPSYVTLAFAIMLFGFASYKGINSIARAFEICGVLFLIVTVGVCILMITQGMHYNILPLYNSSEANQFLPASYELIVPFGGIEILLIIPFTIKNKKVPKLAFLSIISVGLLYLFIVEGTFMVLGLNNTALLNDPFIEGIKIVEVPVIERTDVFYLTFGLTSLFAGMMIIYVAVTEFACKVFSKANRLLIVVCIGLALYILSLVADDNNNYKDLTKILSPYLIIISSIFIPVMLLAITKIKQQAKKTSKRKLAQDSNSGRKR